MSLCIHLTYNISNGTIRKLSVSHICSWSTFLGIIFCQSGGLLQILNKHMLSSSCPGLCPTPTLSLSRCYHWMYLTTIRILTTDVSFHLIIYPSDSFWIFLYITVQCPLTPLCKDINVVDQLLYWYNCCSVGHQFHDVLML